MTRMVWLLMVLLLAGCAATGPGRGPDRSPDRGAGGEAQTEEGEAGARTPLDTHQPVQHEVDNRAVALLWDEAEAARREQRIGDAVAKLERALQLAPEDPVLWSRLAEMRLRQRDFGVAENLAAKSNALAGERPLLRYRNWLLIAEARKRRGDTTGMNEARAQAESLRSGGADSAASSGE